MSSFSRLNLRWWIVASCFSALLLSYINQVTLAIAAPSIIRDFGLSPSEIGLAMSGFVIGYTVILFPGGFLVARFSARKSIAVILACSGAAMAMTGFARGLLSLLAIRVFFGLCSGPLLPAINATVNNWVSSAEKATAASFYITALPLGIILGNILGGLLVVGIGWRATFLVFGALSFAMCAVSWKFLRDYPAQHHLISPRELQLIEAGRGALPGDGSRGSTFRQLVRDPWIWLLAAYNLFYSLAYWANMNWLPTYFVMARGTSLLSSGWLASLPWFVGVLGLLIIGPLSDRMGNGSRAKWLACCQFISVPFTAYAAAASSIAVSLICFSISLLFILGSMSIGTALIWDLFDREDVAKVYGLLAAWMTMSGVIAPYLQGLVFEKTGSFNMAYYLFAACAALAGVIALLIGAREKQVKDLKEISPHAEGAAEKPCN